MVNERIERLDTGNSDVVQVCFDLSDAQLLAAAHGVEAVTTDRYAGVALDANAVLRLRALVALQDQALESSRDGDAGGTRVLTIDGLRLLVHALREWSPRREELGFLRAQDAIDVPAGGRHDR